MIAQAPLDGDALDLVDLLDRLLERGAAVQGDLVLSLAGVDLVAIGLRAVLGSVDTLRGVGGLGRTGSEALGSEALGSGAPGSEAVGSGAVSPPEPWPTPGLGAVGRDPSRRRAADDPAPPRLELPDDDAARGLVRLVLTLVDVLRELMERQAIARMDRGGLTGAQVERLGNALARLSARMSDLKATFGFDDDDLTLGLHELHV